MSVALASMINAGSSLAQGIFGAIESSKNRKINKQLNAQAQRNWERAHFHGIKDRVNDAKDAGVHPLFALGASTSSTGPSFIAGQSNSGSHIGDGIAAAGAALATAAGQGSTAKGTKGKRLRAEQMAQEAHDAQIAATRAAASADLAKAQYYSSEAKRAQVDANTHQDVYKVPSGPISKKNVIRTPIGNIHMDPSVDGAEVYEERYGDIIQELAGASTAAADIYQTYKVRRDRQRKKREEGRKRLTRKQKQRMQELLRRIHPYHQ